MSTYRSRLKINFWVILANLYLRLKAHAPVLPRRHTADIMLSSKTGRGHSSAGRALASQAKGRGFESRCPLHFIMSIMFPYVKAP